MVKLRLSVCTTFYTVKIEVSPLPIKGPSKQKQRMPLSINSSRYQRSILDRISTIQKRGFGKLKNRRFHHPITNLQNEYIQEANLDSNAHNKFIEKLDNMLVKNFTEWAVPLLNQRILKVDDMEAYIHEQEFQDVRDRLWSVLDDVWMPMYRGPVANLGAFAKDKQSIHIKEVEAITNTGITDLAKMNIPEGQKTLSEIQEAFAGKAFTEKIIADMKDWGKRKAVMHATNNVYRATLRGLWAKIKTFDGETKKELINRLYEEAYESLGMCADGHVGRLVNVLVGFDETFKSQVSPMEYFQNNIAKIAENTAPMDFKIEQAKRLMDDINMPEDQRGAWLSAL